MDLEAHFPLIDAVDHDILMYREAHFGGQFSIMLDYSLKEGKGMLPEFDRARIERLARLEEELKHNLAPLVLTAHEVQKIADARDAYRKLRAIYERPSGKSHLPRLIADLIFAEDEAAEEEIAAIVAEKGGIVPLLIDLLRSEEFYDPLFPGYGQAPFLAVKALGRIGDKRAIISLFEALGQGDFFGDDQIIKALKAIGKPAQEFLQHVVKGRPFNEDNEKAAIALLEFKDEEGVASLCFDLLRQPDVQLNPCLATYLALSCAGLKDSTAQQAFEKLSHSPHLSRSLREDMKSAMLDWHRDL